MSDLPQQDTIRQYVADGIETVYEYNFLIPEPQDIAVYVTPQGQQANENSDIKTLNVDYTVQGVGNITGGTVTFVNPPSSGDAVTLSRAVEASIDTNYEAAQTINGINLDNSFEREMLVIQQNQTKFDDRSLRYEISSLVPDTTNRNIVPTLDPGYIWKGAAGGGIVAVLPDENPDCSTLRQELASETQGADGAALVGYYDLNRSLGTTVDNQLNSYGVNTQGNDGARLIGYYNEFTNTPSNVEEALNSLASSALPTGMFSYFTQPTAPAGWALCDGSNYDMVGSNTSSQIQALGNLYYSTGQTDVYGIGLDSYYVQQINTDTLEFTCAESGVADLPNPHGSNVIMTVVQPGAVGIPQIVDIEVFDGSTILAGSYFELNCPSGRKTIFWFSVDGMGSEPSFPGALIAKVEISSSFTSIQVATAVFDASFMQYRVPFMDDQFIRAWGTNGLDPDAANRTDVNGNVVGNVVGSFEQDALQDHQHLPPQGVGNFKYDGGTGVGSGSAASVRSINHTGVVDQVGQGGGPAGRTSTETRPINIKLLPCVKF
jgi:hypothetical protein